MRRNRKSILVICAFVFFLMLSCENLWYHYELDVDFHVQGFIDTNNNGKWDEGEQELTGFTFAATMDPKDGEKPPGQTKTVNNVLEGGADLSFHAEETAVFRFGVEFSYSVTNIPEGYILGKIVEKEVSAETYEIYDEPPEKHLDVVYEIFVAFIDESIPTPTPTINASAMPPILLDTPTPTNTATPTATATPTIPITAELLGYGSYGYSLDFVQFKINNKPAGGAFSALVDGKDYTCLFMTPTSDTLICQGEPFPSGKYVDVILYWNDIQIFSGQIFRAIEEKPTKTPAM